MNMKLKSVFTLGVACAALASATVIANAQLVVNGFHPTDPTVTAKATFSIVGTELHVLLESTGAIASDNAEVLTGLLWIDNDVDGFTTISAVSESLINESGGAFGGGDNTGGNWRYQDPNAPAPASFTDSVGAVGGDGAWGPVGNFPATVSGPAENLNGVGYGIISAATNIPGSQEPFAVNSVLFKFGDIDNLSLTAISDVKFNWGSGFSREIQSTPEPGSLMLLAAGSVPLLGVLRRRRR